MQSNNVIRQTIICHSDLAHINNQFGSWTLCYFCLLVCFKLSKWAWDWRRRLQCDGVLSEELLAALRLLATKGTELKVTCEQRPCKTDSIPRCQRRCCYIVNILYRMYHIKHVHTSEMNEWGWTWFDIVDCVSFRLSCCLFEIVSPKPGLGWTLTGGTTGGAGVLNKRAGAGADKGSVFVTHHWRKKIYDGICWKHI